jgi:chromosome segregation ATPase
MQDLDAKILTTLISVLITLIVTLLFNKLVALPAALKKQREAHRQEITDMKTELENQKQTIQNLKSTIDSLPGYRQQSLIIQQELKAADDALLATCEVIQASLTTLATNTNTNINLLQDTAQALKVGQDAARDSLARLEKREKNALRSKIITEYNLFTNEQKNPEQAWSEMEHHAFFALVHDYEELGGNDYVHRTILPAMNELEIVPMENLTRLGEVMRSRRQ